MNTKQSNQAAPTSHKPVLSEASISSQYTRQWVYLLDANHQEANELMNNLYNHGYQVRRFDNLSGLLKACENQLPLALLYDPETFQGVSSALEISEIFDQRALSLPHLIILSSRNDMQARLDAAKAGALRYFVRPINLPKLNNILYGLALPLQHKGPKILYIDDDKDLLTIHQNLLQKQGMEVMTLSNPLQTLQALHDFQPDLVLLDMRMPHCSGPELARIIRQDDEYLYVPILFLSDVADPKYQQEALLFGGDAFIHKSIKSAQLVKLITTRLDRIKAVKQLNWQLQASLRGSNARRLALDEHAIVSMTDTSGTIVSVNRKFCEISGYDQENLIGSNHRMLKSGRHEHAFYQDMWQTICNGNIWHGEVCNKRKDGSEYWVEATIVPLLDDSGLPYQYVSVRTEITRLKEVQESLKKHQLAMENSADGMAVTNPNGEYIYLNPALANIYGYHSVNQLLSVPWRNLYEQQQLSRFYSEILPQVNETGHWSGEINGHRQNGEIFPQSLTLSRLDDGGLIFVVRDISKEKAAAKALQENEDRLTRSQRYANIGTWDWNIQTGDLHWSERIGHLFGYHDTVPETTYENFLAAVHPDDRQNVLDAVNNCVEKGIKYDIEHRVVWPDGTIRWLSEHGDVTRTEDGVPQHMLGVVRDITIRKELQERLALQKSMLEFLRKGMNRYLSGRNIRQTSGYLLDGILSFTGSEVGYIGELLFTQDGKPYLKRHAIRNITWDDAALEKYNTDSSEGIELYNLDTLISEVISTGHAVINNDPTNNKLSNNLPLGHLLVNNFIAIPISYGNKLTGILALANRPEGYEQPILELLQPFNNTYGAMLEAMRSHNRERRSQEELVKAKEEAENANNAKSKFLSSMSHELRTPLNSIIGFGQLLELDPDKTLTEDQSSSCSEILRAGNHLLQLINEVLDLAKIESGRIDIYIEPVRMCEVINDCLGLIAPLAIKHNVEILLSRNGKTFNENELKYLNIPLETDHVRLRQVLLNLISNAVKYNHPGGKVVIDLSNITGDKVRIQVSDTGPGISDENQAQLFQSFNRLGAERLEIEGTGIGLVITRNIVNALGGELGFESTVGKGSKFWVDIPQHSDTALSASKSQGKNNPLEDATKTHEQITHTVLYIEDNPANLRLVAQLLRKNRKYINLISAHDPFLGIDLALEHQPSLILLDINLPGMTGFEVLKHFRELPQLRKTPVFAISANAMPADIKSGLKAGFDNYITKPINVVTLLNLMDETLKAR